MSTLNVRLDPEDARKALALRERGVVVSDVVRTAIRAEYERRVRGGPAGARPSARVVAILTRHPDPRGEESPPPVDTRDRRALQRFIAEQLARGRP